MDLQPLWAEEDYKNKKRTVFVWKCTTTEDIPFELFNSTIPP